MLYDETNPEMFLPTHLLRGATVIYGNFHCAIQYFYSRTSCEVRQNCKIQQSNHNPYFYSRTSCEVRLKWHGFKYVFANFYSRTSCEVRQIMDEIGKEMNCISTHAPLARCDLFPPAVRAGSLHFYSRTSCEVRPCSIYVHRPRQKFLLTHLLRGATVTSGAALN